MWTQVLCVTIFLLFQFLSEVHGISTCQLGALDILLIPALVEEYDNFGTSVDIYQQTLVAGTPHSDGAAFDHGSAYIFRDTGAGWVEIQLLEVATPVYLDRFGQSVGIYDHTVAVGAVNANGNSYRSGSVFMFSDVDLEDVWVEVAELTASTGGYLDEFGHALSVEETLVVVAALRHDIIEPYDPSFDDNGAVYIYAETSLNAHDWTEIWIAYAADFDHNQYYGADVAISGNNIVIGAIYDDNLGYQSGAAYTLHQDASGKWSHSGKLVASDGAAEDWFGGHVAIDGDRLVVGAHKADISLVSAAADGAAYVFHACESPCNWTDVMKLTQDNPSTNDWFGYSVDISGDMIVVGAHKADGITSYANDGIAYVFHESAPEVYTLFAILEATMAQDSAYYSFAVAVSGSLIALSAPRWHGYGQDDGVVHLREVTCVDNCLSSPCGLGVCTHTGFSSYECNCGGTGFQGLDCQTEIDDCASSPCPEGAACTDEGIKLFSCLHPCESSPCSAYGTCVGAGNDEFLCDCGDSDYTGALCETLIEIDPCASSPCAEGESCSSTDNIAFTCTDIDDCASSPCVNGVCADAGLFAFTCDCTDTGFEGIDCATDFDDCASSPCDNAGTCRDTGTNSFSCECADGYSGTMCEANIDDCLTNACQNGAMCIDLLLTYRCDCTDVVGFTGDYCDIDIDDCASSPCEHGGTCYDLPVNDYFCDCTDTGFDGATCTEDVDDCTSAPCMHGVCVDTGASSFMCECTSTWTGPVCDIVLDSPSSSSSSSSSSSTNNAAPIEFQYLFNGFANEDETIDTYMEGLPSTLAEDIGGTEDEYTVSLVDDQTSASQYVINIVYENSENQDPEVVLVQAEQSASSDLVDLEVIESTQIVVVQDDDDEQVETEPEEDNTMLYVIIAVAAVVIIVPSVYFMNKRRNDVPLIGSYQKNKDKLSMPL